MSEYENIVCVILAGGQGTRLKEVVNDLPKPMAPVAGKPFLEYLISRLKRHGLRDIVFCVGYRSAQIHKHFADGRGWGVRISYSQEKLPLGTGGTVKRAERLLDNEEDFLVMNGDSFLDVDLDMLIERHLNEKASVTMALVKMHGAERYGTVEMDEKGMIVDFSEKRGHSESQLINGGVYVFNRKVLDLIPEGNSSLENDIFPALAGNGIHGMAVEGFFIDIGVPGDYRRLQEDPQTLIRLTANGDRDDRGDHLIHPR
jgi:NDP-sugar pyrophosphorylase family protein